MTDSAPDDGPGSYFTPLGPGPQGGRLYRPTQHVQGAWRAEEQHLAPVCGLLVHALEQHEPRPDLQPGRVTFDALGVIGLADGEVTVRTVRPGRTIEQVEAAFAVDGRAAVRATLWRLARTDTSVVAGGEPASMPGPDGLPAWQETSVWPGGYIRSLEVRGTPDPEPGRARVWVRPRPRLVEGEQTSALAAWMGVVDTANGVSVRAEPQEWLFPNVDLTVHLFRRPTGEWLGLDTQATFGPDGLGLTSSVLHDVRGPVGRAAQSLTVRPRR